MVALDRRVTIAGGRGCASGIGKFRDVAHRYQLRRWRGKVAGIGGVKRRALEEAVDRTHARTRLVCSRQPVVEVETHTIIDRKVLDWLPFVLCVNAVDPGLKRLVVD